MREEGDRMTTYVRRLYAEKGLYARAGEGDAPSVLRMRETVPNMLALAVLVCIRLWENERKGRFDCVRSLG